MITPALTTALAAVAEHDPDRHNHWAIGCEVAAEVVATVTRPA